MKYIVEKNDENHGHILELQDDGTYKKIANTWNIEASALMTALANAGVGRNSVES